MITKVIEISDSDILYDVNFITWKTAKCRIAEPEAQAEAQTDGEALKWFSSQLYTCVSHVKGILKWCASDTDDGILFSFSDNWRGNFDALSNYIHRYIADYILYEWFKMTLPNEAATYLASATEWESKIINEARSEDVRNVYFRL